MYTGKHVHLRPLQPAFIMANSGEAVTYRELEARKIVWRICFASTA
jgi:long-chain acyl-CoA synthetase